MWAHIATFILRKRLPIIISLAALTAFLGYYATKAQISYEAPRLLPDHDSIAIRYKEFKNRFGQDGSVMVIGISDSNLYAIKNFNAWFDLGNALKKVEGVKAVVSIARVQKLIRNDALEKFETRQVFSNKPTTQNELDSIKKQVDTLVFYKGIIFNDTAHATLMAITFDNRFLNTKQRVQIVDNIISEVNTFVEQTKIEVHYSGMPYIRTAVARKIENEMTLFMILAIIVTAIILMVFFRSVLPVIFSLLVVIVGVVWSIGLLVLWHYQISVLTALIPPLLIVSEYQIAS